MGPTTGLRINVCEGLRERLKFDEPVQRKLDRLSVFNNDRGRRHQGLERNLLGFEAKSKGKEGEYAQPFPKHAPRCQVHPPPSPTSAISALQAHDDADH